MKLKEQFSDIIAPLKYIDSKIARTYKKTKNKLNLDMDERVYVLSHLLNGDYMFSGTISGEYFLGNFAFITWPIIGVFDWFFNISGMFGLIHKKIYNSNETALDPASTFFNEYNKIFRLPLFMTGVGFLTKSGIDVYNHFTNGESLQPETFHAFNYGRSLISIASSMYLKDNYPKLLEKQPMWKDTLDLAKKLLSIPMPEPVTVEAHYSLEN